MLRCSGLANDVDVLLVYPDGEVGLAHRLAESIRDIPEHAIVDVLALSATEERELGFLDSEQIRQIWPENS
jgi:hypothetical protein